MKEIYKWNEHQRCMVPRSGDSYLRGAYMKRVNGESNESLHRRFGIYVKG